MKTKFKNYHPSDYESVCAFLIELSKNSRSKVNWNWARWEWMVFHPEFDHNTIEKIGLWFYEDELVGMTTYDHYFGEAFYGVKEGFEELEREVVEYAIRHFENENGLGIAVNIEDHHGIDLLLSYGFEKNDNFENILENQFVANSFEYERPKEIQIKSLDINHDLEKHHQVLWQGFENEGEIPLDEKTMAQQKNMLLAPHLDTYTHLVAVNEKGEYVAYCGCWYNPQTDYAYVEPVCTIPSYRKQGLAKALILEALERCSFAGAQKAYVISDSDFYKNIGFSQHSRHDFYWYQSK